MPRFEWLATHGLPYYLAKVMNSQVEEEAPYIIIRDWIFQICPKLKLWQWRGLNSRIATYRGNFDSYRWSSYLWGNLLEIVQTKNVYFLIILAFRHAGTCLTLVWNTVEENLRGMKEWRDERMKERKNERKKERKNERMNDTQAGFLILDCYFLL